MREDGAVVRVKARGWWVASWSMFAVAVLLAASIVVVPLLGIRVYLFWTAASAAVFASVGSIFRGLASGNRRRKSEEVEGGPDEHAV